MGLFDTVILDKAKMCTSCGEAIESVQTKAFFSTLREYRIGDIVSDPSMFTGIIREELYCSSCSSTSQDIYFSIWHTLLTGIYDTAEEAEQHLLYIDRAELMDYINRHQKEAKAWHERFVSLFADLKSLYEYQRGDGSEDTTFKDLRFLRIREFIENEDPLDALIEAHRPDNED